VALTQLAPTAAAQVDGETAAGLSEDVAVDVAAVVREEKAEARFRFDCL
jgi:hypothetical protein